ncbi:MAG TPA: S53 family peptidase, partial [Isosphaeraceae bacterium]|nr:S53 family peptidase [Isosphaeraceae bacterium]
MSTLSFSRPARRHRNPSVPARRHCRFPLACEPLELRQLLSVFQGSSAANPALSRVVAQPNLPAAPLYAGGLPTGLSPNQVTTAYGVNQINFGKVAGNGAGQTIAIIDAYFDPNIRYDLATFDAQFGLAAPPSVSQFVENGMYGSDPGWAIETALDVEWAHAVAPAANIMLVEAQPDLNDMFSAVTFASKQPGVSVVSMSWGANEFQGENAYDSTFTTPSGHGGVTFVASSGDSSTTLYPAASPNVLAVGGTTLNVTSTGQYLSETAWSGSGGGSSPYETKPAWQTNGLAGSGRTTPDIAFDADPSTGVSVYSSVRYGGQSGWFTVGGTSVGPPAWAGLVAITDQGLARNGAGSLANAQSSLYQISSSSFNNITSGSNGYYTAGPGYDLVTGLGSPKAKLLVPGLVALNSSSQKTPPVQPFQHGFQGTGLGSHLVLVTSGSTSSATGTGAGTSS